MHEKTPLYQEIFEKNEEELIEKVWEEIAQRQDEQKKSENKKVSRGFNLMVSFGGISIFLRIQIPIRLVYLPHPRRIKFLYVLVGEQIVFSPTKIKKTLVPLALKSLMHLAQRK